MLELNHQFRVVDVHARLDVRESSAGPAERLEREMHQAGVVRSVVFPPTDARDENGGYVRANNAVARSTVERPLVAFARLNGPRDPGDGAGSRLRNLARRRSPTHTSPDDIEHYAYDDRFHGFALDPARDGLPDAATLDALATVDLPVLVRACDAFPPAVAARTLLDRSAPVVIARTADRELTRDQTARAIDLLDDHDALHLDTSAVRYRDPLERALREHPDRMLFGSGAPAVHPNVGVMEVLTLDAPADAMRRVFSKNAARVISPLAPQSS